MLAPLRRAWVREFLGTSYRVRAASTRSRFLRAVVRLDAFLTDETDIEGGQWSLVTTDHLHAYLSVGARFRLQETRAFLRWLHSRKGVRQRLAESLPRAPRPFRLRVLPLEAVVELYQRWTSTDAKPTEALVGLLALVHCLRAGEIRYLLLDDVLSADRLRVGEATIDLAPPVAEALARYVAWRREWYAGPSTYLIVSRGSRLHDRPVASNWFAENLLGISVAALRQTAIQRLIQGVTTDGLQLAAYARLSLSASGVYMSVFSRPDLWPPSSTR